MEGVEALVRQTDDPEVVVTEIPIAVARLLGRTSELAAALASA
jgi:hypothetical protein